MTNPPHEREIEYRVELLREVLKSETPDYDLMHREMARVLIAMYGEISTLAHVRNELARLTTRLLIFMDDQIDARITRSSQEAEGALLLYEKSQKAMTTSQNMRAIVKKDLATVTPLPPQPAPSTAWAWFRDRVAPGLTQMLISGLVAVIGVAIWQAFKTAVLSP